MWTRALSRIAVEKTQPVLTSARLTVRACPPRVVGPQRATASTSNQPGSSATSSPALRIAIWQRSSAPGLVVVGIAKTSVHEWERYLCQVPVYVPANGNHCDIVRFPEAVATTAGAITQFMAEVTTVL
ncbi:MAG: hypothetical protein LBH76_10420 [Propionibacteriaceae bacterium]|jgi:hypothetical protein|nr:hypothetical protein [Propionibacteriaceae bacterium]